MMSKDGGGTSDISEWKFDWMDDEIVREVFEVRGSLNIERVTLLDRFLRVSVRRICVPLIWDRYSECTVKSV